MYSLSEMVRLPSSTISALSLMLAAASARVGSSSTRPFMYTTSAAASSSASLGLGSNVCELVPSGTMPVTSARSPTMFATMLVIGATVVAIVMRAPSVTDSGPSCDPHADAIGASRTSDAITARRWGVARRGGAAPSSIRTSLRRSSPLSSWPTVVEVCQRRTEPLEAEPDTRLGRVDRHAAPSGHLVEAEVVEVASHDRMTMPRIDVSERGAHTQDDLFADERLVDETIAREVDWTETDERSCVALSTPDIRSHRVDGDAASQHRQVRLERALVRIERRRVAPQPEEHLLGDVGCVVRTAHAAGPQDDVAFVAPAHLGHHELRIAAPCFVPSSTTRRRLDQCGRKCHGRVRCCGRHGLLKGSGDRQKLTESDEHRDQIVAAPRIAMLRPTTTTNVAVAYGASWVHRRASVDAPLP